MRIEDFYLAGYCTGIVEAVLFLPMWGTNLYCTPKGVTVGQGMKVLVKYMNDHPEELHERTMQLAARAFQKAWPCRTQ
jgi:hypothetical protein